MAFASIALGPTSRRMPDYTIPMCRGASAPLFNFEPPATEEEIGRPRYNLCERSAASPSRRVRTSKYLTRRWMKYRPRQRAWFSP